MLINCIFLQATGQKYQNDDQNTNNSGYYGKFYTNQDINKSDRENSVSFTVNSSQICAWIGVIISLTAGILCILLGGYNLKDLGSGDGQKTAHILYTSLSKVYFIISAVLLLSCYLLLIPSYNGSIFKMFAAIIVLYSAFFIFHFGFKFFLVKKDTHLSFDGFLSMMFLFYMALFFSFLSSLTVIFDNNLVFSKIGSIGMATFITFLILIVILMLHMHLLNKHKISNLFDKSHHLQSSNFSL
jgi:hypothetical protein